MEEAKYPPQTVWISKIISVQDFAYTNDVVGLQRIRTCFSPVLQKAADLSLSSDLDGRILPSEFQNGWLSQTEKLTHTV